MIFFFLVFLVAVALYYQRKLLQDGIDGLTQDQSTDVKLVEVEEPFTLKISLSNMTKHFMPFVKVSEMLPKELHLVQTNQYLKEGYLRDHIGFTTWLAPRQKSEYEIQIACQKRGRYLLKDLVVSTGDFLGMDEQSRHFSRFIELVVPPVEKQNVKVKEVLGGLMGDISVRRFLYEDPVLTAGYREYTGREPMKSISWSQSAKGLGLMVKQYDHTLEPSVSVVLNLDGQGCTEEMMEDCFSYTRSICAQLEKQQIPYDLYTNAFTSGTLKNMSYIDEGLGTLHFMEVLECLGRANCHANESAESLCEKVLRMNERTMGKILITPNRESKERILQCANRMQDDGQWTCFVIEEVES